MPEWLESIFSFLLTILPGGLWMAFWYFAVNWKRLWIVLEEGAWVPVLLLIIVSALVWSQISPSSAAVLGFMVVPNFWWQLGSVSLLAGVALFAGWLQTISGYTPAEVPLDPPEEDHGHAHH